MASIYLHKVESVLSEVIATKQLKTALEEELRDVDGQIWLIPSVDIHPATGRHDVDLVMMGYLDGYYLDDVAGLSNISIKSFIATIEIKSHTADGVHKDGTHLMVEYPGTLKDVTVQSNEQKESLKKFLCETLNYKGIKVPFIVNLIWLVGVDQLDYDQNIGLCNSNILVSDSRPHDFFNAMGRQCKLRDNGYVSTFANYVTREQIKTVADIFCAKSDGADSMTLRRINLLNIKDDFLDDIENRAEKMIVLAGHAGTGKTIRLLKAAQKLSKLGKKCLFLTYNTALISDLVHTLRFISDPRTNSLRMDSMYSFFIGMMRKAGIWRQNYTLEQDYKPSLANLNNRRDSFIIPIDYDYIFIDEAQDWSPTEASVLLHYSQKSKIVIADGIDQFMKSGEHTNWGPYSFPKLRMNLRQRSNLVSFVKIFASKMGVYWDVESSRLLPGGRLIITHAYEKELHDDLYDQARQHGCTAYDLMLLAPNSLVENGHFKLLDSYKTVGINLFDGVYKANRDKVYGDQNRQNNECRVFTYESCRGLEAWTVVCLRFDQLFDVKYPHAHDYHELKDYTAARNYMLTLWSLIPLSRAIDTLVLVVTKGSTIDGILKEIALDNPDYISYPDE